MNINIEIIIYICNEFYSKRLLLYYLQNYRMGIKRKKKSEKIYIYIYIRKKSYLRGAYEEELTWTESLQSGKATIFPVRQNVPGFVGNLQSTNIRDVLVLRHVPIKLRDKIKGEKKRCFAHF